MSQILSSHQYALIAFVWNRSAEAPEPLIRNRVNDAVMSRVSRAIAATSLVRSESSVLEEDPERWDGLS